MHLITDCPLVDQINRAVITLQRGRQSLTYIFIIYFLMILYGRAQDNLLNFSFCSTEKKTVIQVELGLVNDRMLENDMESSS